MIKTLDEGYLLFIEPTHVNKEPVIDSLTKKMFAAWLEAVPGLAHDATDEQLENFKKWMKLNKEMVPGMKRYFYNSWDAEFYEYSKGIFIKGKLEYYKGSHTCSCGEWSTHNNYLITSEKKERRVIVNSLCVHYLTLHRDSIPQEQLDFVDTLEFGERAPSGSSILPSYHKLQQAKMEKEADRLKKIAIPLG